MELYKSIDPINELIIGNIYSIKNSVQSNGDYVLS